jgi:hypothetical protein
MAVLIRVPGAAVQAAILFLAKEKIYQATVKTLGKVANV